MWRLSMNYRSPFQKAVSRFAKKLVSEIGHEPYRLYSLENKYLNPLADFFTNLKENGYDISDTPNIKAVKADYEADLDTHTVYKNNQSLEKEVLKSDMTL